MAQTRGSEHFFCYQEDDVQYSNDYNLQDGDRVVNNGSPHDERRSLDAPVQVSVSEQKKPLLQRFWNSIIAQTWSDYYEEYPDQSHGSPRSPIAYMFQESRRIPRLFLWIVFALFCAFQIYLLIRVVVAANSSASTSKTELDFLLYKNTKFHTCQMGPRVGNCSLVESAALEKTESNVTYLGISSYDNLDWCRIVGCFSAYTVIPSKPRPSAFLTSSLMVWFWINLSVISVLWKFNKVWSRRFAHRAKDCPGFSVIDYFFFCLDTISVVLWWYAFTRLALDLKTSAIVSTTNWMTTWSYIFMATVHPLRCKIQPSQSRIKIGSVLVAFTLMAIGQYAATWWTVAATHDTVKPWSGNSKTYQTLPRYDCAREYMSTMPGINDTSCSADRICSRQDLYIDPGLRNGTDDVSRGIIIFLLLAGGFLIVAIPGAFVHVKIIDDFESFSEIKYWMWTNSKSAMLASAAIMVVSGVCVASEVLGDRNSWFGNDEIGAQESVVVFDATCKVVHVAMSPWRQYIDVGFQGQALRVVKLWFNA